MEDGGYARGGGYASSSSHAHRSASPVRSDRRGFRAGFSDVQHKLREFYTFDLMPKTFIVKFRQRVQGIQLGANFEFDGVQVDGMHLKKCNADDCHTKLVIKPSSESGYWKVVCEPKYRDLRILTKKIPLGSLLHFQFGVGHDFIRNSTGWKWKVTSAFGLPGSPEVRQKTKLPIFPGFDINVDWNAQYELPELHGLFHRLQNSILPNAFVHNYYWTLSVSQMVLELSQPRFGFTVGSGTGESPIEANLGHLHAKVERVAAVYTHVG